MDELHQKKLMRFFVFARLSSEIGVTDRFRVTKTNIFDGSFYHNRTNRFAASPAVRFEYDRMCRVVLVRSPPLQKSRHGNNSCDPEESTRLEDIQYIARTIPHTGTWPGPSTGPRSAEALTCRPPPRTGCCILRQEQQPPAHTAIRTSSVRNSPASKHGALKICSYGDIPRFLPR